MKIAKLNIEGYIGGADLVSIFSGEETFGLSKLKSFLDNLEEDVTDIHVYINSGGGLVNEGWAIYDKLKVSGKKITTIGEGIVGSIATVIFMAGSVRKLHENSQFFIHNPYWAAESSQPMEGDDLIKLGEELKSEQKKILDFYIKQTGSSSEEIEPLMLNATSLTTEQALSLGFATERVEAAVNHRKYKLVAMIETNKKNQNIMSKETGEVIVAKMNAFEKLLNKLFKGKMLNMNITTTNGNGDTVNLYIESETEDITGKDVFIVDADGNQTPAPDGDYADADGKTIKVSGGKVAEVVAVSTESDEVKALKAEIETLKAENKTAKDELQAKVAEIDEVKANVKEINTQFEALRKTVIGEGAKFETGTQDFKNRQTQLSNPNAAFLNEMASSLTKKR